MSLKKNAIANFVGQGWTALMGLAFIPLYIKYLGIEAYGLIGFYAVMQAWLTLFDVGITQTLNREMARFTAGTHTPQSIHDLLRSLEVISVILAIVICFFVWMSSHYIATHLLNLQKLNTSEVASAIALMGFVIALRFIEGIYKGALLGLQKQIAVNIINIIVATMRYGLVVAVLAWYSASIEVFFIWQALSSIVAVILFVYILYSTLPKPEKAPIFSTEAIKKIWRFARGMLGITLLTLLLTQVDKILLLKLISLEDYGYYALAGSVVASISVISSPITITIYPKLVQYVAQDKTQELTHLYHLGAQLLSVLITPIAMMLVFFGKDIIYLWSGDVNLATEVAPILMPLAIGSFFNCLVWMPYQLQLAYGWTSFAIKVNAVAVALLVPIIFFVAPQYGAVGVAWVWALLNFGYVTISMHFMYKKLLPSEKWRWYWNDVIKQLFCVTAIVSFAKLLTYCYTFNSIFTFIIFAVAFCLSVMLAILQSNQIHPLVKSELYKILY